MELAAVAQPLEMSPPCGEDMSFSAEFDAITEARRFDDPSLDQGEWVTDLKQADWPEVVRICTDLLAHRTKDLRLAVWLTEALTKTQGAAGLTQGYELLTDLCANHWADVHPQPDDDGDQEERIGNLDWLLTRSGSLIKDLPLTQSDKGRYSSFDLECARNLTQSLERNQSDADELQRHARVTQAQFDAAREDTPGQFFADNLAEIKRTQQALTQLQVIVDKLLGADGPAFGATHSALEGLHHTLDRFATAAGVNNTTETAVAVAPSTTTLETSAGNSPQGPLTSRAQALQQLRQVADFFRDTEPHSPVAYLAEKAANWGEMSLHQWLKTVVKDDGALSHVEELLGVPSQHADGETT